MDEPKAVEPASQPSPPPQSPPPSPSVQQPPPPPPAPTSLIARLMNVFAIPGDVFEEIKHSPVSHANWVVPALLLLLVSWGGMAVIFSQDTIKQQLTEITDKAIDQHIKQSGMSEAQAEQVRKVSDIGVKVNMGLAPIMIAFATPFFWGLLLWLGGSKVMRGNFDYMKAVEVAGLANAIVVLEAIVKTLLIVLSGNLFATPSLAFFIKQFDPQNTTHGLLAAANLMTLWLLVVRSIGLARLSSVSFNKAALWVFGAWLSYTGFFIILGLGFKAAFAKH